MSNYHGDGSKSDALLLAAEAGVRVIEPKAAKVDTARQELIDHLSEWPVGEGYYMQTISTAEAAELADSLMKAGWAK